MARRPVNPPASGWSLTIRERDWRRLSEHLFSVSGEHGAVVLARIGDDAAGRRLLAEHVILARNGVDYVEGEFGHRALTASLVRDAALAARSLGLAYLAVHNHQGTSTVDFSPIDRASHRRGYPAIRQLTGQLVGAVVCTPLAATGALWLPDGTQATLEELVVPSGNLVRMRRRPSESRSQSEIYDRQARLFGDLGQECFGRMSVAVVGQGGVGSLLTELLARLGVGRLVLVDPDVVDPSNIPRLLGAEMSDVGLPKVHLGRRNALRANPQVRVVALSARVELPSTLRELAGCDWIFLAADGHAARHWVTQIVETELIPGTQLGVKIPVSAAGDIGQIHVATRRLIPGQGCMWCNGLIDPTELAIDMHSTADREAARYVAGVPAASVISLNAMTASRAVTDFMLSVTNMFQNESDHPDSLLLPRLGQQKLVSVRRESSCPWCGDKVLVRPGIGA